MRKSSAISCTLDLGRDVSGEVFGPAIRVDLGHLHAEQAGDGLAAPLARQGRHDFEVRVIIRIPFALVAAQNRTKLLYIGLRASVLASSTATDMTPEHEQDQVYNSSANSAPV